MCKLADHIGRDRQQRRIEAAAARLVRHMPALAAEVARQWNERPDER